MESYIDFMLEHYQKDFSQVRNKLVDSFCIQCGNTKAVINRKYIDHTNNQNCYETITYNNCFYVKTTKNNK